MKTWLKVLALMLGILVLGSQNLGAQPQFNPAGPLGPAPQWTPIPQVPGVEYAPNLGQDLFRYGSQVYHYNQGAWQVSPSPRGPWKAVKNPPPAFYNIGPTYFKSPPGWAKGKKTGWGEAPLPPGQMKKFEGERLPPGQMKK